MVSVVNFTKQFRSYFIIALGLFIGSIGWTAFLIPSEIVGGGVTGIATIIYFATGFKVGYSVFIINGLLLVLAMRVLGFGFGIKTIFATFVLSFFLWLLQSIFTEPLVSDRFMCAIIGGIMAGASAGIILSQGGSTGGTDIIAMMINKYRNYSPGQLLLTLDLIIISSSYFLSNSIEQVVYGFVAMGVSAYCVDMVIEGSKQSVQIFIFTKKHDEIRNEVVLNLDQGLTVLEAKGGYSQQDVKVLMLLAKKKDSQAILKMTKIVDPDAFISMGSVMGVYGQGFDKIK
tara:strand:+ start:1829 stop:2689 length:861 start_codon:yes stop_codon:yes gene_type:complete